MNVKNDLHGIMLPHDTTVGVMDECDDEGQNTHSIYTNLWHRVEFEAGQLLSAVFPGE